MNIDLTRVSLRWGYNTEFLNIDYDDREIGHLRIKADGRITECWAKHFEDRPLIELVARCHSAIAPPSSGPPA